MIKKLRRLFGRKSSLPALSTEGERLMREHQRRRTTGGVDPNKPTMMPGHGSGWGGA
jgi:hypothetical protein